MPDADTREPEVALGESWVARALEGVPVGDVPRQTFADYEGGRVCVNAVACSDPGELWLWFSAAAAKRASLSGHRLAPLVASGQFEGGLYSAYGLGEAIPLAAYREHGEMSTEQILQFLWAIARGIDESVRAGLQPVEISPESLFVDPQRGALLADLGLAREVLGNPPAAIDVNAAWVAPEILRGSRCRPALRGLLVRSARLQPVDRCSAAPRSPRPDRRRRPTLGSRGPARSPRGPRRGHRDRDGERSAPPLPLGLGGPRPRAGGPPGTARHRDRRTARAPPPPSPLAP